MNTATTPALPSIGDNINAALGEAKKLMAALGRSDADGNTARRDFGVLVCREAYAGRLTTNDAGMMYDIYETNRTKKLSAKKATGDNPRSRSAQISKLNAFIKLGLLAQPIDGPMLLDRAIDLQIAAMQAGVKVLPDFEAMRTVCVKQCENPTVPLTDAEITAAVSKNEPVEKDTLEKLCAAYKAARKLAKDIPMQETQDAADSLADAITSLGGTVPPVDKKEKDEMEFLARFAAHAASLGMATV